MKKFALALAILMSFSISGCGCGTVEPGNRGVIVDWGKVVEPALQEGFHTFCVVGCDLHEVSVRQQKRDLDAPCFSDDMQQVDLKVSVLYRIPEASVTKVFRDFHGEPFDVLIGPRVQESIKEATSSRSAEMIVKQREAVKLEALVHLREKVGDILVVEDLIIADIALSKQLTASIESKMVQEQEAEKAKYTKQKAEIDAEMAVAVAKGEAEATMINAKAEAESIKIRGEALRESPGVVQLQLIQKWDGVSPQIVAGGGSGLNVILPAVK